MLFIRYELVVKTELQILRTTDTFFLTLDL